MAKNSPEDLHPDDVANLNRVRAQLKGMVGWQQDHGVSATELAARVGRNHWFHHVLTSERTWPGFWKFSTFHDLCVSVDMVPTVVHPFDTVGSLWEVALVTPKLLGVACQEVLEVQRVTRGVPILEVAKAANVAESAVWRTENANDSRLSTLQRYARAYGGYFKFGLGEK